jgi:hypothetical protein
MSKRYEKEQIIKQSLKKEKGDAISDSTREALVELVIH